MSPTQHRQVAKPGRVFFFEKKNQKTFIRFGQHRCFPIKRNAGRHVQKFFASFFKKEECLPCLPDDLGNYQKRRIFTRVNCAQPADGGAEGNRTPDLLNAIQALSQLSYGPRLFGRGSIGGRWAGRQVLRQAALFR